jgi:hypothetical protein
VFILRSLLGLSGGRRGASFCERGWFGRLVFFDGGKGAAKLTHWMRYYRYLAFDITTGVMVLEL